MSLNHKEIDLILSELPLAGCHIQGIRQPDFRSLILDLYRPGEPWTLLVNLSQSGSRLHRISKKPENPKVVQRFAEFLRSRIRGARITEAVQVPEDRIVKLSVNRAEEATVLWIRLWGAASNIIATDSEGKILDAFFRRPKKGEESGGTYFPQAREADGGRQEKIFTVRPHPEGQSFNDFIEEQYGKIEEDVFRKRLLDQLESRFKSREVRLHASLNELKERREEYRNVDLFRLCGDLIMSNLHTLTKGDLWLKAKDFETNTDRDIELSATLSPYENAEAYYQRYKKAKNGFDILEDEIRGIEIAIAQLAAVRERMKDETDVKVLAAELGKVPTVKQKTKEKGSPPGLKFSSNGFTLLVGRTGAENDEILRRHVRGNDYWLHTRDFPGGYVFIKNKPGKSIPLETLLDAGNLAVFYSKARSQGSAELYYTQVKYLRRAKGEKIGTVLPTHEKNLSTKMDEARLDRLQNTQDI